MPRFRFILALLAAIAIATVSHTAAAETTIHGITIPTVDHNASPSFRVCTATGSFWQQNGNGAYGVGYCFPRGSEGVRPVGLTVPETVKEALRIIESSVNFDHDSIVLSDEARSAIQVVNVWMAETPTASLIISGHTDATGSEEYNEELSKKRALAVALFLASDRVYVQWYGETDLLVDSPGRERANRRVEIHPSVE
jgi:outer membrane protein OmpA-like peptidoglycan-associated protein